MRLKVFKILMGLILSMAIFAVVFKISLFYVTRRLPWQKPVFDTAIPEEPTLTGAKGVLIFSKTNGYRHESIEPGRASLLKAGKEKGWNLYATENGAFFNDKYLQKFKVVVFLSTTGNILTPVQQKAFQRWIENGGGYVGIHAASDTEYDWPWYQQLVGTRFRDHPFIPHISEAEIITDDLTDSTTRHLPVYWRKSDEWYNFKESVRGKEGFHVLLSLNEASYRSLWPIQRMHGDHPVSWMHVMGRGRMFYTAMGHSEEAFRNPRVMRHILAGIAWAGNF